MTEWYLGVLLLLHVASTVFMAGVIWFVQGVHYPLFAAVGRSEFPPYERRHAERTTRVVAPAMLLEMATAVLLLRFRPVGVASWQVWTGVLLLGGIWASTAFVQVPFHRILAQGFDPAIHRRLVTTNWMRTAGWSLRAVLVTWMLASTSR